MSGVSKEERDRLGDEICWKELHLIPYHATSLTVCGLLDALDDADKKIAELERLKYEASREFNEIQNILAEALGYPYDDGYVIGDHDAVTLAMEARRKLGGEE